MREGVGLPGKFRIWGGEGQSNGWSRVLKDQLSQGLWVVCLTFTCMVSPSKGPG